MRDLKVRTTSRKLIQHPRERERETDRERKSGVPFKEIPFCSSCLGKPQPLRKPPKKRRPTICSLRMRRMWGPLQWPLSTRWRSASLSCATRRRGRCPMDSCQMHPLAVGERRMTPVAWWPRRRGPASRSSSNGYRVQTWRSGPAPAAPASSAMRKLEEMVLKVLPGRHLGQLWGEGGS